MKEKIQLTDSIPDVLFKISEGNPGALNVCINILKEGEKIDPDNALGGLGVLLSLDTLGLYGSKIWMLYKDVCDCELSAMLAVLRAWQLGFATADQIHRAVDNRGDGLNVADMHAKVVERLPSFAVPNEKAETRSP